MTLARTSTLRMLLAVPVVALLLLATANSAHAKSPILSFAAAPSTAQAAGHPDVLFRFAVANRRISGSQSPCNCEDPRDAVLHLPAGFIGSPTTTPLCTMAEFSANECAIDSQVGVANVTVTIVGSKIPFITAVYNLAPPPDVAALLGFKIFFIDTPQFTVLSPRTDGDFGLDATTISLPHGELPFEEAKEVLWGVPALRSHDQLRIDPATNPIEGKTWYGGIFCDQNKVESADDPNTVVTGCGSTAPPVSSNSPSIPFLQNSGRCEGKTPVSLDVLSYDGETDHADREWPALVGCDQLSFNPSLYAQPTTDATDTPSGIDINLTVPQQVSPTIPSPSELKATTVTLPPGFSINPNAADGKSACSDFSARFGTRDAAECPEFSKVGTVVIENNSLPGPLPGSIYLGEPQPGDPYRILLVGDGFGVHLKLRGSVVPNRQTGQLTVRFDDLPETPLSELRMHFFGSERALLATPTRCGAFPVTSTFTPWSTGLGSQTSSQFFSLTSGPNGLPCPITPPFSPSFAAASKSHSPGAHAPFWLEFARPDGDQDFAGATITTPPGFSATLAGIPYCSNVALARAADDASSGRAEAAQPSCPAASRIGTSIAGAGAGTHPLYLDGDVYLAGPYKGAPLSLAVVTPAVSGPYDLGNVVVRAALNVDPADAHITAIADPLPQILDGIPLRLRSIRVDLDRQGFALNPTNCHPNSVDALLSGTEGGSTDLTQHFQVANCRTLPFAPTLALRLGGNAKRLGNPPLSATLTAAAGSANIGATKVVLPHSLFIDNAHINAPCTRVQFAQKACPEQSKIGFARAETPLLDQPLEGPVYLRSASGGKSGLPDVVAALRGQVDFDVVGHNESAGGGRLRTSFVGLPDVPLSRFTLKLEGGKKGLLESSESLCAKAQVAQVTLEGQNGKVLARKTRMRTSCGNAQRGNRPHRAAGARR